MTEILNRLVPVTFSHAKKGLEENKEKIAQVITSTQGVILEYFLPELRDVEANPLALRITNYERFKDYFSAVADMARGAQKNIIVADPAQNTNFAWIRATHSAAPGTAAFFVGRKLLDSVADSMLISRRNFLIRGFNMFIPVFAVLAYPSTRAVYEQESKKVSLLPIESTFRRVIVAKGIRDLLAERDPAEKFAVVYPDTHFQAISYFLQNPNVLDSYFQAFSAWKVTGDGATENWFSRREYAPSSSSDSGWELKSRKVI